MVNLPHDAGNKFILPIDLFVILVVLLPKKSYSRNDFYEVLSL